MVRTHLDLERLRYEIRKMNRNTPLYKMLKTELMLLGYWRNKPRGNPSKARQVMLNNRKRRENG